MNALEEVALVLLSKKVNFNYYPDRIIIPANYGKLNKWQICLFKDGILKFVNTMGEEIDNHLKF